MRLNNDWLVPKSTYHYRCAEKEGEDRKVKPLIFYFLRFSLISCIRRSVFFLSSLAVCLIQLVAHTCFFICMKTDKSHVELCTWWAFICLILPSSFLLICHCYVLSVFVLCWLYPLMCRKIHIRLEYGQVFESPPQRLDIVFLFVSFLEIQVFFFFLHFV